ncbi:MAG: hypothetical protein KJ056_04990 [Acidimicrobiia bacterium]|nr:hypothetical protein [Acidimicrobiia bacterium]
MESSGALAAIAQEQHGVITLDQCRSAGLSLAAVSRRVGWGWLRSIHQGVYAVAGSPLTFEQRICAAVMAGGPGAVASHESAAYLHQFPNVGPGSVEISTARPDRRRISRISTHRTQTFLAAEHGVVNAIPITSYARTLVDLSARLSVYQLGAALDDGLRRGVAHVEALRICAGGLRPAPGRRLSVIHALLGARLPGYEPGDSDLELRFVRALVAAGLPEPVQQYEVRLSDRMARLDLAYPSLKVAIEVDGFAPHSVRSRFDRDRARQNELVLGGWLPLRWTSATTDERAVDETRRAIRTRLASPAA